MTRSLHRGPGAAEAAGPAAAQTAAAAGAGLSESSATGPAAGRPEPPARMPGPAADGDSDSELGLQVGMADLGSARGRLGMLRRLRVANRRAAAAAALLLAAGPARDSESDRIGLGKSECLAWRESECGSGPGGGPDLDGMGQTGPAPIRDAGAVAAMTKSGGSDSDLEGFAAAAATAAAPAAVQATVAELRRRAAKMRQLLAAM